jgi:hypothetical protein
MLHTDGPFFGKLGRVSAQRISQYAISNYHVLLQVEYVIYFLDLIVLFVVVGGSE